MAPMFAAPRRRSSSQRSDSLFGSNSSISSIPEDLENEITESNIQFDQQKGLSPLVTSELSVKREYSSSQSSLELSGEFSSEFRSSPVLSRKQMNQNNENVGSFISRCYIDSPCTSPKLGFHPSRLVEDMSHLQVRQQYQHKKWSSGSSSFASSIDSLDLPSISAPEHESE